MTKRIVSGVFLLIALGALGLILAGALTSGEQLIVRFLTAIIVAALGLYVISDLRLQADDSAVAGATNRTPITPSGATTVDAPPNSTAAFMATVTGKRSTTASLDRTKPVDPGGDETPGGDVTTSPELPPPDETATSADTDDPSDLDEIALDQESTTEQSKAAADVVVAAATDVVVDAVADAVTTSEAAIAAEAVTDGESATEIEMPDRQSISEKSMASAVADQDFKASLVAGDSQSPYGHEELEVGQWPLTPDGKILEDVGAGDSASNDKTDGLAAVFAKQSTHELRQEQTTIILESYPEPVLVGAEGGPAVSVPFKLGGVFDDFEASGVSDSPRNPAGPDKPAMAGANSGPGFDPTNGHAHSGRAKGDAAPAVSEAAAITSEAPTPEAVVTPGQAFAKPTSLPRPEAELQAASYAHDRIVDLRLDRDATDEIESAIRSGEVDVISSLIDDGGLSTEGPISDRDVRTMVFVAFTSSELRKILLAGGTVDTDAGELDLGPVEVFSPSLPNPSPELTANQAALVAPENHSEPSPMPDRAPDQVDAASTPEVAGAEAGKVADARAEAPAEVDELASSEGAVN